MHKRFIASILSFTLFFFLFSCNDGENKGYAHCEMTIPLPSDFYKISNPEYDVSFTNGSEYVAILRLSYVAAVTSGIPETLTTEEFGEYWLDECERNCDILRFEDVDYCDYAETVDGVDYRYLAAFYRSKHAYFVVLFAVQASDNDSYTTKFLRYAADVYFTD